MSSSNQISRVKESTDTDDTRLPAGHGQLKVTTTTMQHHHPLSLTSTNKLEDSNLKKHNQINFPIVKFSYPLKIIVSRSYFNPIDQCQIGLVYILNYGGGLVSGDRLSIDFHLDNHCHLLCLSQGSTKVYKEKGGSVNQSSVKIPQNPNLLYPNPPSGSSNDIPKSHQSTKQNINARIGSNAIMLMLPSYVTCFRDSSFTQKQIYHLQDQTSSLICLDWFTSGRTHSTRLKNQEKIKDETNIIESWNFKKFQSFIEIYISNKRCLRDNLVLINQLDNHPFDSLKSQNKFIVYANLFLICSTENPTLIKIFNKLKELDGANKTQPRQQNHHQQDSQMLWCFSEIPLPTTNEDHLTEPSLKKMKEKHAIINHHDITNQDHNNKIKASIKIGIVRIGSHCTILVRNWLQENLIHLVDFIGPEFYSHCF